MQKPLAACQHLDDAALLDLWDRISCVPEPDHTRILLSTAYPSLDSPGRLPVGTAWHLLLEFRIQRFGASFPFVDTCPSCGEGVEFELTGRDFLPVEKPAVTRPVEHSLEHGPWSLRFRTLCLGDWEQVAGGNPHSAEDAAKALLSQALIEVKNNGKPLPPEKLPEKAWEALSAALSERDPWAEISFNLHCPACRHEWDSFFEPDKFLLQEVRNAASRLLREIHELAAGYGWREADILKLSEIRRNRYLQLLRDEPSGLRSHRPARSGGGYQ
jgi:hypothetical protein